MLNFVEMLNIYNRVGIYNYTFECLKSGDSAKVSYATNKLRTLRNENDVYMFIAYSI